MNDPLPTYLEPLPLIAVLRGITPEEIPAVGSVLAGQGFRVLEVPLNVGDDAFGRALLCLWTDEGLDTRGVATDPDAPTGIYFVTHGRDGHEFSSARYANAAAALATTGFGAVTPLPRDAAVRDLLENAGNCARSG